MLNPFKVQLTEPDPYFEEQALPANLRSWRENKDYKYGKIVPQETLLHSARPKRRLPG